MRAWAAWIWAQVVSFGTKSANSSIRLKSSMEVIKPHFSSAKGDHKCSEESC
jgi:hypothetical protein